MSEPLGEHVECLSKRKASQAEYEDQANHDQDVIDTSKPVNHPPDERGANGDQHPFGPRQQEPGLRLARSPVGELQRVWQSCALPKEKVAL